jgi:Cellulase (glycosyl hydrolase family 5)
MRVLSAVLLATLAAARVACAASWAVSVDERQGLPTFSRGGASALSSRFVFWGNNWAFAGQPIAFKVTGPSQYTLAANNRMLNFSLAGRISRRSPRELVWEFELDAPSATRDVIGGGISFRFDLASYGAQLGEPALLGDNRGWAWGRAGGERIEMRFDPPLPAVYFERGQKSEVRAFFYQGEIAQGKRRYTATLSVAGDVSIEPTATERFGLEDPASWPADILDWRTSPVDLAFLNAPERPAGKHGFLKATPDGLVFEDGTPARFWGTNLAAYALFGTSRENVRQQARRLSELGFNLVRLHHHDSPWVNPNIFGDRTSPDTRSLSPAALEKLDWWIKCLKDEGIYVWLDLHVQRQLKPGDQIEGFDEISRDNPFTQRGTPAADLKGYSYVNASIQQAMKRFNESYVNRQNSYTGTRYKDEPAIVAMLLTNENDITQHFGNALLPIHNVRKHTALYMALSDAFASEHHLPRDRVWRAWEHGPSKLFLNDLEHRFDVEMIAHLRSQGVKVPIATTSSWGFSPVSALPALTTGQLIDAHAYGGVGDLEKNPYYAPNLVHWLAAAHVAGRPLTVTEWNVEPFPVPDRHSIPLYVAAAASHQGWSALMQFAYAQSPLNGPGNPSNWDAFNDPSLIATLPAAALMYRQRHVDEARTLYAFAPSAEQLFNQMVSPQNSVALRTAAEKGKLVIAMPQTPDLPWLEQSALPASAHLITDPTRAVADNDGAETVSDTGQLRRDWQRGIYLINTPRSQGVTGWIGGRSFKLADVEIAITTRHASAMIQSMDGKPIGQARRILISLGARSLPARENSLPFHSEPVLGQIWVRAPAGLHLVRRDPQSGEERPVRGLQAGERYLIRLERDLASYWLLLK